jgi:N-acetylglucosamine-6-sulfatase
MSINSRTRHTLRAFLLAGMAALLSVGVAPAMSEPSPTGAGDPAAAVAATPPNIVVFNLDDLRDAFPGGIDPLQYMPKTRQWLSQGRRFTQSFVADPSCCPSRSSMMTGRYPHNNGVLHQHDGQNFDGPHSMACYLRSAGYSTYLAGKFLISWPKTQQPPCFDHSTVMWGGYQNVSVRVDGAWRTAAGYSTTYLGNRGREYITQALGLGRPFLLYETPHAPHWSEVTNADGTTSRLAIPAATYASAPVGSCAGVPETDRSDKTAFIRNMNITTTQAQTFCRQQMRALMTVDDEFAATMQLLADRGVLADTLVILTSDNGYMWGEHGRTEKFIPYEPSIRVPLYLRWPGHIAAGTDGSRIVSGLDLLPTMLEAAGFTLPANAPRLDGESLLRATQRTMMYSEYYTDTANPGIPYWRMVRTRTAKYIEYRTATGSVTGREYYNLTNDPAENLNLLGDGTTANDPPAATITELRSRMTGFATCTGTSCIQ